MIAAFAMIALLAAGPKPHYAGVWLKRFAGHEVAAKKSSSQKRSAGNDAKPAAPPNPPANRSGINAGNADPTEPSYIVVQAPGLAERKLENGDWDGALALAEPFEAAHPDNREGAVLLADLYLHANRPDKAVAALSAVLPVPGDDRAFWLRAAVASGLQGQVYRGERAWLVNVVTEGQGEGDPKWTYLLPQGETPQAMVALGALELAGGGRYSGEYDTYPNLYPVAFFGLLALKFDPGNPLAARYIQPNHAGNTVPEQELLDDLESAVARGQAAGIRHPFDQDIEDLKRRLHEE